MRLHRDGPKGSLFLFEGFYTFPHASIEHFMSEGSGADFLSLAISCGDCLTSSLCLLLREGFRFKSRLPRRLKPQFKKIGIGSDKARRQVGVTLLGRHDRKLCCLSLAHFHTSFTKRGSFTL
ncbi:hypothetical protein NI18_16160 [Sphingomonas sp. Ant20]|nr:hypothetical protein NI18_16160 [Sphingomonas sp. Ant20]